MEYHTSLSDEELHQFKEAFSILDRSGTGKITIQQISDFLQSLGQINPTLDEIRELIKDVDIEKKGAIDFPQFLQLMEINSRNKSNDASSKQKEVNQAWKMFDLPSTSEVITVEKMQSVLDKLGESLTKDQVKAMIDEIEQNTKGELTFEGINRRTVHVFLCL